MTERTQQAAAAQTDASTATVIFRLHYARAQQVFVIGAFNNWSTTATPMDRTGADRWEATVSLPPGQHEYCYFVIDEAWFTPMPGVTVTPTVLVNSGSIVCVPGGKSALTAHMLN